MMKKACFDGGGTGWKGRGAAGLSEAWLPGQRGKNVAGGLIETQNHKSSVYRSKFKIHVRRVGELRYRLLRHGVCSSHFVLCTVTLGLYLVDNNLREIVLLVPATMVTPGGVAVGRLLPTRRGLAAHELTLGAEAVVPLGGLLHAAAYRERLGQKEHRDGDKR